jgi:hypothetical protein
MVAKEDVLERLEQIKQTKKAKEQGHQKQNDY